MSKEFKCRWPQGIERLKIGHGFSDCAGKPSISLSVRCGLGVGGSVHLHADDAVEVAQALAVEWYELVRHREAKYRCQVDDDYTTEASAPDRDGHIALSVESGLAYLSKPDARSLAMDLLRMSADAPE